MSLAGYRDAIAVLFTPCHCDNNRLLQWYYRRTLQCRCPTAMFAWQEDARE